MWEVELHQGSKITDKSYSSIQIARAGNLLSGGGIVGNCNLMEEKAVFHLRYQLVFSVMGFVLISMPVTAGIVLSGYIHFDSHLKNCVI